MSQRSGWLLLVLTACGGATDEARAPAPASAAPAVRSYRVEQDTRVKTPRGASFPVAAGWRVTEHADRIVLEDPEAQLRLVQVEVEAALDRRGAQLQSTIDGLEAPGAGRESHAGKVAAAERRAAAGRAPLTAR